MVCWQCLLLTRPLSLLNVSHRRCSPHKTALRLGSQKLEERIQKAAKKNAAFEDDRYERLDGNLEFCDFRELQDAITSKASWKNFEPRFANKETLISKFGQLAELRNGIRHSRTVDEITRKEGEAAILWFGQVLNK